MVQSHEILISLTFFILCLAEMFSRDFVAPRHFVCVLDSLNVNFCYPWNKVALTSFAFPQENSFLIPLKQDVGLIFVQIARTTLISFLTP